MKLQEVLDHATDALNRVQPDFFTTFREEDAVQYFYEPFLEAFDPQLRKDLGVWYTPREIVRYMVERVDRLLRTELNEPLGLASPNVQVLDPCCGTGAYLVEVLHRIERTLREQAGEDDALVGSDLRTAATTRIFGFEIMPAPFVIAHLQIAQLLEDAKSSLAESQRAQIFLTNALTGWIPARHPQSTFGFPDFIAERDAAEAVKQADTILVILGNPPYNGYAGIAKIEEERDLTNAYREAVPGVPSPQGQGLNDLYIRFFRVAERRISENTSRRGIVSLISNYSWLTGLSHTSMRHHLLQDFSSILIDNLNGDKYATGKRTPEGAPDPSAFSTPQNREGIQVGTGVATMVSNGSRETTTVRVRNFWGASKLQLLNSPDSETYPNYVFVQPHAELGYPLADRQFSAEYTSWPRITDLFATSFPGVKTSRDYFVVDIDRDSLESRMQKYFDSSFSNEKLAVSNPLIMIDGYFYEAASIRRTLIDKGFRSWQILKYIYRPFDVRWIYWEPTAQLLRRPVPDYIAGYSDAPTLVIPQQNRRSYDPAGFVTSTTDLNLVDGGANAFPAQVIRDILANPDVVHENTTQPAEDLLQSLGSDSTNLLFYCLAILHSRRYSFENSGALLRDWPRIPLPATAELLTHSATLGRRLGELLDPESSINLVAEWSFLAKLSIAAEFPEGTPERDKRNAERLALTAGWGGSGQGATVMPRRGDARERDWTPTELERLTSLAAAQSPALTLDEALTLLGPRCVDVYLNGAGFWAAVPLNVWDYTLGGYQVLKKWLSYRELPLLGRPLREDEARYFAQVVRRIAAILLMGPALDASYAAILPTATGLPSAAS